MNLGFDLDNVFVSLPQFVPYSIIDFFYKKREDKLSYRIPGKVEQKIRTMSHTYLIRPPININIEALHKIYSKNKNIYLISSRFSFLKKPTDKWISKTGLKRYFKKMYFNFNNEQPHKFKNRILNNENIKKFADDDLDLLLYLAGKNPNKEFYWINQSPSKQNLPDNIKSIRNLTEFYEKYL